MLLAGMSTAMTAAAARSTIFKMRVVAEQLGIPYYVLNLKDAFRHRVIDVYQYAHGHPDPVYFAIAILNLIYSGNARELDADFVATGHYARIDYDAKRNSIISSAAWTSRKPSPIFCSH
jgi:tRNA-specific 2-thiouridylase